MDLFNFVVEWIHWGLTHWFSKNGKIRVSQTLYYLPTIQQLVGKTNIINNLDVFNWCLMSKCRTENLLTQNCRDKFPDKTVLQWVPVKINRPITLSTLRWWFMGDGIYQEKMYREIWMISEQVEPRNSKHSAVKFFGHSFIFRCESFLVTTGILADFLFLIGITQ